MDYQTNFLRPSKKTVLLILLVMSITLLLSSAISIWLSKTTNLEVPSIGMIKTIGVEVYWDEYLENKTEVIEWDIIWVGSSNNITLYVRSVSNMEISLQLNTTNWKPKKISEYLLLSWDYNETLLNPGEKIKIILTLTAPYSIPFVEYLFYNDYKEFNFDIIIHGNQ